MDSHGAGAEEVPGRLSATGDSMGMTKTDDADCTRGPGTFDQNF